MREDRGRFAALRDEHVFVYWPHGLGDWAHLTAILPLLEPSNAYAIGRFGDDYSALLEGNRFVGVLRSGECPLGDGSARGRAHFGLRLRALDGRECELRVPEPFAEHLASFGPTAVLWTDYPETEGRTPFPFHTKARNLAHSLVHSERLAAFDLTKPLPTTLDRAVDDSLRRAVEERLAAFSPPGSRAYVLSISGYTAERKNWDTASARELARLIERNDPRARAIVMGEPNLGDASQWPGRRIVAGYGELFGDLDAPFARIYLALLEYVAGVIAVPAGPLHVAMARGGVRVVGLWNAHLPEWYDEPNPSAVHLVGSYVRERGFHRRLATKTLPAGWHSTRFLETRAIPAETVFEALRE